MSERQRLALALFALLAAAPAAASVKTLSVTDFDRIQVTGSMAVIVRHASATTVRISGDSHDLDTVDASVHGQTLKIGPAHFGWGSNTTDRAPITIYITTPRLSSVMYTGSGRIDVEQLRGPNVTMWLSGTGSANVAHIEADSASLAVAGAGRLVVAGRAGQATIESVGSATLDANALRVEDAKLKAYGSATINAEVSRSADATATGAASISVTGHPACTVHNSGGGTISCN